MELQHVIWTWESIIWRLLEAEPDLGRALARSCRPMAAQRYRDGRLLVVLGCWWPADRDYLSQEASRARLNSALSSMLADQVVTNLARWPGGMADALPAEGEEEQIPAPEILRGLPDEAREEAAKCESAIQRLFFARAYARGLRFQCQYPLLHYRLDFAVPEKRVGAEVMGWDWRTGPMGQAARRDREEEMEQHGWRIAQFSGSQVLSDVEKCVATLTRLVQTPFEPGQQPLPSRFAPQRSRPFTILGTQRPSDRDGRRGPPRRRP